MRKNRRRFMKALAMGAVAGATAKGISALGSPQLNEGAAYEKYKTVKVELKEQVATITISNVQTLPKPGERSPNQHWELGQLFGDLRGDNRVRVIVITGPGEGIFHAGPRSRYGTPTPRDQSNEWLNFGGIRRVHQEMAESEKIIVAKVNGDAVGFGQSLVFASDLIVAREDAIIADFHLGMGEIEKYGPPDFGVVPGDGGCALIPLFMSPAKAKEYLLLGKQYTAAEMARMGIINYAVPPSQLDATVDDIVTRLLKRSTYGLAWAKRVANRRVVHHLNMTLDAAAAYEQVNFLQLEKWGWKEKKTFL